MGGVRWRWGEAGISGLCRFFTFKDFDRGSAGFSGWRWGRGQREVCGQGFPGFQPIGDPTAVLAYVFVVAKSPSASLMNEYANRRI